MMRYLWETIAKVLKAAVHDRGQARLIKCMLRTESIFHLENDSAFSSPWYVTCRRKRCVWAFARRPIACVWAWPWRRPWPTPCITEISGLTSDLRGTPGYCDLISDRRTQPPYHQRRIEVEARITRSEAAFAIRDEGNGFNPAALPGSDRSGQSREGQRPRDPAHAGFHGRSPLQRRRQRRGAGQAFAVRQRPRPAIVSPRGINTSPTRQRGHRAVPKVDVAQLALEQIQARRASEDIVCSMEFTPLPYPAATQFQGFSAPAVRSSWPGIRVFILAHPHARMKTPLRAAKFASTQITTHFFSVKSRLFARVSLMSPGAVVDEHH